MTSNKRWDKGDVVLNNVPVIEVEDDAFKIMTSDERKKGGTTGDGMVPVILKVKDKAYLCWLSGVQRLDFAFTSQKEKEHQKNLETWRSECQAVVDIFKQKQQAACGNCIMFEAVGRTATGRPDPNFGACKRVSRNDVVKRPARHIDSWCEHHRREEVVNK